MSRFDELKRLYNDLADIRQSIAYARTYGLPIITDLQEKERAIKENIMALSTDD